MEYKPKYFFSLEAIFEGVLEGILALYPAFMIVILPFLFVLYYPNAAVSGSIIFIFAISIIRHIYQLSTYLYLYLEEKRNQKIEESYSQTIEGIDKFEYTPETLNFDFSKKDLAFLFLFAFWAFICIFLSKNPSELFSPELSKNFIGKFLLFVNNLLYNHEFLFSICCIAIFTALGYLGVRFRDMLSSRE